MNARNELTADLRSPFGLENDAEYRAWRDRKLATAATRIDDLMVTVRDPGRLTAGEREAILSRCRRTNMAIYAGPPGLADKTTVERLGAQLGLRALDGNWLADEDGISSLQVAEDARGEFVPYTDRAIHWHTDGYYNPPACAIGGMILHCVRPAVEGGANALLDHEIAYILLRDADPQHVRALCHPLAMTIPARHTSDASQQARASQAGPVFSLGWTGDLHMRYTHRTRSIKWRAGTATAAAIGALRAILDGPNPLVLRVRLEAGMGLVCNNVLHDRTAFVDDPAAPRLLYRARYRDRIAGTRYSYA